MVNIPINDREDKEPEYTYCCGTCCDSSKLAWEYEDLNAKVKVADKLVADLLAQIEVLNVTNRSLGAAQAKYYGWYLEECDKREKLTVELGVLQRGIEEVAACDKPAQDSK
jgi:hypothetical protein